MDEKNTMEELKTILERFASSGWEPIAVPAQEWIDGRGNTMALLAAVSRAEKECANCGCDLDSLYSRALTLLSAVV